MLSLYKTTLEKTIIHKIGSKHLDQGILLSNNIFIGKDSAELNNVFYNYFLSAFKDPVFYRFDHPSESVELNDVYTVVRDIFKSPKRLETASKTLAKILYDSSEHPKIKPGEFYVAYFKDCLLDEQTVDAIGLFKSENKQTFLTIEHAIEKCDVKYFSGISIQKLDKGALILNVQEDEGFKVAIIDNLNSSEAVYWKEDFLKLSALKDSYSNTKNLLSLTKEFVSQLPDEFELSKTDQIDLLNRSIKYFKNNESFNKKKFEAEVFEDKQIIDSFRKFGKNLSAVNADVFDDDFQISGQAVKKQAKVFKSVLKLDKNFDIHIHGNQGDIEKGIDQNGRKYYKLYFDNEY